MLRKPLAFALLSGFASITLAAIPSIIPMPSNGIGWYTSPGSPFHTTTGGIGGADDTNAQDLNLPSDGDNGLPVYAIADGFVVNSAGWGGNTYGQFLLKHFNPDGSPYYCGYLHMRNVSPLKASTNAYVPANTQIGTISNVNPDPTMAKHLHFACYEWNGAKYVSKPISPTTMASRLGKGLSGSVYINSQVVNRSPFPVSRNSQFTMNFSVTATQGPGYHGKYFVILSRDINGSDPVGKVGDYSYCASYGNGTILNTQITKSNFSSPAGQYFLQIYHSDSCATSDSGHALQRVSGAPIAISLQ